MIQAIFFDQDNTLVNTKEVAPEAYKVAIGDDMLWQRWREAVEKIKNSTDPTERTFKYSISQVVNDKEKVKSIVDKVQEEIKRTISLKPGVKEFFENKIEGVKYILMTEDFDDQINSKLNKFGLKEKFDLIVGSEMVGTMKPNVRYLQIAWEKFELDPKKCLYIGDNYEKDCRLGVEAGGKALVFGQDFMDFGELAERLQNL